MSYIFNVIVGFILMASSCQKNNQPEINEKPYNKDYPYIAWDIISLRRIAAQGAYPRMHVLNDKSLMLVYERGDGNVVLRKSENGGNTWGKEQIVYTSYEYTNPDNGRSAKIHIANPEFIQLPNDDILFACNLRPDNAEVFPYAIAIKRSTDKGATWSEAKIVYEAAPRFDDGCWEPAFLHLPNGEVQLYFANENPYRASNEQEISMIASNDNGNTWTTTHKTVSFRSNHRDGMPVPIVDDDKIRVAIEDNVSGQFKPYIVSNPIADNWKTPVWANSEYRYSALKEALPANVYAGAPYLIKTDGGFYVLSYQTTRDRASDWKRSTMEVVISDEDGRNFKNPSRPFTVPLDKEAKWGSVCDIGNGNIMAVTSTNFNSSTVGIWLIKGKIVSSASSVAEYSAQPDHAFYPNPTNDFIYFSRAKNVHIYSMNGTLVASANTRKMDVSSLPEGMYVVKTENNGVFKNQKLMKL